MMSTPAVQTRKSDTKSRLMDAGEQLFSRHGLDAVTIRQINQSAGQRNTSSLLYHFGSKEGLVEAIFADRFAEIDARRHEMLEAMPDQLTEADIPALAKAAVLPFVEHMRTHPGGTDFIRFFALVYSDPQYRIPEEVWLLHTTSARRLAQLAMSLMPHVPRDAALQRVGLTATSVFHWLANWSRLVRGDARIRVTDEETLAAPPDDFVGNIIDLIIAAVKAPYSGPGIAAREDDG